MLFDFLFLFVVLIIEFITLRAIYRNIKKREPDIYFLLSELKDNNTLTFFLKYLLFRFLPIFIVCLINYKFFTHFTNFGLFGIYIFNQFVAIFEASATNLKAYRKYRWLNLAYLHLFVGLCLLLIPIITYKLYPVLDKYMPSAQGILDNIWSALIIFAILSVFNLFSKNSSQENELNAYDAFFLLNEIREYSGFIESESLKYNANYLLAKSIAIYESKQRPSFLRLLEWIWVFVTRKPTSQGVMQYTSPKFISNKESITLAIENYLQNSSNESFPELVERVNKYNPSEKYKEEIFRIYSAIGGRIDFSY